MNKKRRKRLCGIFFLAVGIILTGCSSQNSMSQAEDNMMENNTMLGTQADAYKDFMVEFINVGKADSALIKAGDKAYLIDTGEKESVPAILAVLQEQGIEKLEGVFLTHKHSDHIGGLKKLSKEISIETVYSGEISMDEANGENKVENAVEKAGLTHVKLSAGDQVELTSELIFEVIGPLTYNSKDDNDNSLVLRLVVNGKVFLFTGDMQFAEEASLMEAGVNLKADVLKVGNHGNPDATSEAFAQAVSPEIAVISTNTSVDTDSANVRVKNLFSQSEILITQDYTEGIKISVNNEGQLILIEE